MYTAVPAVVAGYPLLEALQACRRQAMAAEPGPGRAPFNRIAHSTRTWMHGDRDFNTPTVDLLYSNAWIDLRQGPVVLEIPARSRFFVVQLLDVHTENFFNLGTRNVPAGGAATRCCRRARPPRWRPRERRPCHVPPPWSGCSGG